MFQNQSSETWIVVEKVSRNFLFIVCMPIGQCTIINSTTVGNESCLEQTHKRWLWAYLKYLRIISIR